MINLQNQSLIQSYPHILQSEVVTIINKIKGKKEFFIHNFQIFIYNKN